MNMFSRRRFLQVAGAAIVAAALPAIGGGKSSQIAKRVRIRPLSSQGNLRPGEMDFYRSARFASPADAMRAVAARGTTAEIYVE